jgi:gamma-glutamylcyclotransferase (GGCT)/AIG2-like uncharacterized protein YtfP
MNQFLFVYGTLQSGFRNPFAQKLHSAATCLGAAWIPGKLFRLGNAEFDYPGAVYEPGAPEVVHGELWRLDAPGEMFSVLDEYEGISPEHVQPQEYRREEIAVEHGGGCTQAWCYVLNRPVAEERRIASGRFTE